MRGVEGGGASTNQTIFAGARGADKAGHAVARVLAVGNEGADGVVATWIALVQAVVDGCERGEKGKQKAKKEACDQTCRCIRGAGHNRR